MVVDNKEKFKVHGIGGNVEREMEERGKKVLEQGILRQA